MNEEEIKAMAGLILSGLIYALIQYYTIRYMNEH